MDSETEEQENYYLNPFSWLICQVLPRHSLLQVTPQNIGSTSKLIFKDVPDPMLWLYLEERRG